MVGFPKKDHVSHVCTYVCGNHSSSWSIFSLQEEVDKMTRQRHNLVSQFREQMTRDDITKNLVGHLDSDKDSFMEDRMRQFKELASVIRHNLSAQENILTWVETACV